MKEWEKFRTFKERGEWVELQFMAEAASHGYHILKPCGDSLEYDVAVEHSGEMIRVQVKSSANRNGTGYLCYFRRGYATKEPYSVNELDIFAAYIIPEQAWYLIPAAVILKRPRKGVPICLCPMTARRKNRYRYEQYREAWHLLGKTRCDLIAQGKAQAAYIRNPQKGLSTDKRRRHPAKACPEQVDANWRARTADYDTR
jgi:PD-(D/E)XK nuclease superfamily protein